MAQEKSFNSKTGSMGKAMRRTFGVGIPTTITLSAALAVVFAIAIDGCSGSKNNNRTNTSVSSNSPSTVAGPKAFSSRPVRGAVDRQMSKAEIARKKSVAQPLTTTYADSVSGVSFHYPKQYTLVTPEKALNSQLLDRVPMNFVQAGGMRVATLTSTDPLVAPLLEVSVHKGLTAQQCDQFANPSPAYVGKALPLDPIDDTLPSKVKINRLDFMRVDNGTDQTDTRYYHHFENGSCYEFGLAVVEKPGNLATADHQGQVNALEQIMNSVEIKAEGLAKASVATSPISKSR
jgi:hypothetical protein